MRDPERIKKICRLLAKAWEKSPDERFGQFLSNWVFGHHVDIWFQEDDMTKDMLEQFLQATVEN